MAIDPALIKWYQCTVWAEGSAHGGDIDTGNEITSGADQNISGTIGTDTSATMDQSVEFNSINEMIRATINQDDISLPAGNYRMFARVKDLLQISNDLK